MKIQENKKNSMVPFSRLPFGDVFRYHHQIVIKVRGHDGSYGTLQAINLADGKQYIDEFKDGDMVESLTDATLVIN
jgi:hypothetical protein